MLAAGRDSRRQLAASLSAVASSAAAGPSSAPMMARGGMIKLGVSSRAPSFRGFLSTTARASADDQNSSVPRNAAEEHVQATMSNEKSSENATSRAKNGNTKASSRRQTTKTDPSQKKPLPIVIDTDSFPSLLHEPHPILDRYVTIDTPPEQKYPYPSSVFFFNSPKAFPHSPPTAASRALSSQSADSGDEVDSASYLQTITPLNKREITNLQQHLIKLRRIVKMTGKGKNARMAALCVAGNGRGLVGMGEGKDENAGKAASKAFHNAVTNMDYVERHEGHTIPAEIKGKWSSTTVTLRPRPHGFGLQVPPVIHRVARACGITDLSASIIGSTNPYNVLQATLQLLWGGSAPLGLGDGVGGSMRRRDRGMGMRTVRDIELMRGRRLREIQLPSQGPASTSSKR